jgi:hypothetical protein
MVIGTCYFVAFLVDRFFHLDRTKRYGHLSEYYHIVLCFFTMSNYFSCNSVSKAQAPVAWMCFDFVYSCGNFP